jgi:hypothetical protein
MAPCAVSSLLPHPQLPSGIALQAFNCSGIALTAREAPDTQRMSIVNKSAFRKTAPAETEAAMSDKAQQILSIGPQPLR